MPEDSIRSDDDDMLMSDGDGNQSDTGSATGSERGQTARRYENAVLRILQRALIESEQPALKRLGEGASALVTRERRQALLAEVKRRMREERGLLRGLTLRRPVGGARTTRSAGRGGGVARGAGRAIQRRWRYTITGAEDVRVRDHYGAKYSSVRERVRRKVEEQRAKMEEPTAIRLRDKLSFMLGVVGCGLIEACVLKKPELYPYLYLSFYLPLYAARASQPRTSGAAPRLLLPRLPHPRVGAGTSCACTSTARSRGTGSCWTFATFPTLRACGKSWAPPPPPRCSS